MPKESVTENSDDLGGWIKVHRQTLDSRVFSDEFLFRLWMWCLLKANWKRGWFMDREIKPGQFATGKMIASNELGVSGSKWYRGMTKLAEFGNIKIENVNNRFTRVEVVNWGVYQSAEEAERSTDETLADNRRKTGEPPVETIEEGKKVRKEEGKKKFEYPDDFETFWEAFPKGRKSGKRQALKSWRKAVEDVEPSVIIGAAKEYAESDVGKGQYVKGPGTWLNKGCWEDDREAWKDSAGVPRNLTSEEMYGPPVSVGQQSLAQGRL